MADPRDLSDSGGSNDPTIAWLAEHYPPEQIAKVLAPPQPKIASILDLIEKARSQTS